MSLYMELQVSFCKMLHFVVSLHVSKQKRKQTLERARYGLVIILKLLINIVDENIDHAM